MRIAAPAHTNTHTYSVRNTECRINGYMCRWACGSLQKRRERQSSEKSMCLCVCVRAGEGQRANRNDESDWIFIELVCTVKCTSKFICNKHIDQYIDKRAYVYTKRNWYSTKPFCTIRQAHIYSFVVVGCPIATILPAGFATAAVTVTTAVIVNTRPSPILLP